MAKKTIIDFKNNQDQQFKKSNVQHIIKQPYYGIERKDMDSRPIAGSDAIFGSYDYFGGNRQASRDNPSVGPFWRMQQINSLDEFFNQTRKERKEKINNMNKTNTGVNQQKISKLNKLAKIFKIQATQRA